MRKLSSGILCSTNQGIMGCHLGPTEILVGTCKSATLIEISGDLRHKKTTAIRT